jgi:hypothetical protein
MKQFSQLILLSSLSIVAATSASQTEPESSPKTDALENVAIDVPARPSQKVGETGVVSRSNRSPAVEPRVYVEQGGALYYYDYPNQPSHADPKPPAKL